jgi:subtilisin family serine protease
MRYPLDRLDDVLNAPDLQAVLAPPVCQLLVDSSATDVRVAGLRTVGPPPFGGQTGAGVLVGIVDTGIDVRHDDFRRADGSTRIYRYWDQTVPEDVAWRHPHGFTYGQEWTNTIIDDLPDVVAYYSADSLGHGTHVAGIAAGNGKGGFACKDRGKYVGVAPGADLCVVRLRPVSSGAYLGSEVGNAVKYVFDIADSLNEPAVVNISLGTHWGGHDGTYFFDHLVGDLTDSARIVVAAAGNEAQWNVHATVVAQRPKADSTATLTIPPYAPKSGAMNDYVQLRAWYGADDSIAVWVVTPSRTVLGPVGYRAEGHFTTTDGKVHVYNESGVPWYDWEVDNEIEIVLEDEDANYPPASSEQGPWEFRFSELKPGQPGQVDIYIEEWRLGAATGLPVEAGFEVGRNAEGVVRSPATGDSVIAVGAHAARECWAALGNVLQCDPQSDVLGDLTRFSSHGPRRDGVWKPDLSAPGACVVSTKSAEKPMDFTYDVYGGKHTVLSGTSQAAPHVTGAAALLLARPGWGGKTPSEIIAAIREPSRSDAMTGAVPNGAWGYGKLSVATILSPAFSVGIISPTRGALCGPTAFTVVVGGTGADSVVLDLAVDSCRTRSTRIGTLFNLAPDVPRTLALVLADSMASSYATLLATAYADTNRVQVISPPFVSAPGPVAVDESLRLTPRFALDQNAPNPFNPLTTIEFEVAQLGPVTLRVYGVDGCLVRTLIRAVLPAGPHVVRWNGCDDRGVPVGAGVYFCEATSGGERITRKMTVLK